MTVQTARRCNEARFGIKCTDVRQRNEQVCRQEAHKLDTGGQNGKLEPRGVWSLPLPEKERKTVTVISARGAPAAAY